MNKTFGDRVAQLREEMGLNQSELARRIKKTPQTIQKIEGGGNARPATVTALVRELKTTKAYLLAGDEATIIDADHTNSEEEEKIPLVEWENMGLSLEEIHDKDLVIDDMPLVSGDATNMVCAKLEGGDWVNLMDDTIAYVKKDVKLEDVKHGATVILRIEERNIVRKLFIDGSKRIAVTTNESMPKREHEIQPGELIGVVTGFYISAEV